MISKFEGRPALAPEQERTIVDISWEIAQKCEALGRLHVERSTENLDERLSLNAELMHSVESLERVWKNATPGAESLLSEGSIESVVRGNLKTTIAEHGPITANFVPSATKRITRGLLGHLRQASMSDLSNVAAKAEVERLRKEVTERDEKLMRKQVEIRGLLDRLGIPYNETKGPQ